MTEPVARAVSSRRTVRVAVALVAGQAGLCAVIGWVTFGPPEAKPDQGGVHPLTQPMPFPTLLPIPPEVSSQPPRPSASKAPRSLRASRLSRPATTRAASKPAADKPRPVAASRQAPSEPPPPPLPEVATTARPFPPPEEVQSGVVEGRPCAPDGGKGRTVDLVELRCAKDADGDLVWQIN